MLMAGDTTHLEAGHSKKPVQSAFTSTGCARMAPATCLPRERMVRAHRVVYRSAAPLLLGFLDGQNREHGRS